jgi:diacylglycerol kinase (ATP)
LSSPLNSQAAQNAIVLLNPHAGGGRVRKLMPAIAQWLRGHAPHAALVQCHAIEEAQRMLRDLPAPTRVALVGGDGTAHHVLAELVNGNHTLALVPVGSGNDTARALGVHALPWQEALRFALSAPQSLIDLGEFASPGGTPRLFISSLAAGFDAAIALRAHRGPKWLIGLPRYLRATLLEVAALSNQRIEVLADGKPVHNSPALFASVLNTRSYGSGMPVAPTARVDDGQLNLLVAGQFGRVGTLAMLPRLLTGTHLPHPRVATHTVRSVQLSAAQPLPLAADGEPVDARTQVTVRILPSALRVVRALASSDKTP